MNTTANAAAGTYYPNVPGARTLKDSKPLYIGTERVSAVVSADGSYAVFAGTRLVAEGALNGTEGELMVFFAAEAMVATTETESAEASTNEPVSAAVASVRESAAALLDLATEAETVVNAHTKPRRGMSTMDPRHPARQAATYRRYAALLANWSQADEDGYGRYVSDGIADTDGYYTPIKRENWKALQGA